MRLAVCVALSFWAAVSVLPVRAGHAQRAAPRLQAVADLRIGGADSEDAAFGRVSFFVVGRDGSWYVADDLDRTIRHFDARGRFVRAFGRRGRGPGEFQQISAMGWRGDTLWIADSSEKRISQFHGDGRFIRTVGAPVRAVSRPLIGYDPTYLLQDGTVLSMSLYSLGTGPLPARSHEVRTTRRGQVLDTLMVLSMVNSSLEVRPTGGAGSPLHGIQPLGDHDLWDVAPDGSALVVARRRIVADQSPPTFHVTRLSARGDTLFSRPYRYPARPVTRRMVDSLVGRWTTIATQRLVPARARAEQAVRRALYLPAHLPPITAVVAGRDGTTWLRREAIAGTSVVWTVLDAAGNIVATVTTPRSLRIREADLRTLWGVELDADDVPSVVRYRLQPVGAK